MGLSPRLPPSEQCFHRPWESIQLPPSRLKKQAKITKGFTCCSTEKVIRNVLVLLGAGILLYWSVCDPNQPGFCTPRDLTSITLNLSKASSVFK